MLKLIRLITIMAIFMSVFLAYPLLCYATPLVFTVEKIDEVNFPSPSKIRDFNSFTPMQAGAPVWISDTGIDNPLNPNTPDPAMFGLYGWGFHNTSGLTFYDFELIFHSDGSYYPGIYSNPSTVYPNVSPDFINPAQMGTLVFLHWEADQPNGGIKDGEYFQVAFSRHNPQDQYPHDLTLLPSHVPEPSSLFMVGFGLLGVKAFIKKFSK